MKFGIISFFAIVVFSMSVLCNVVIAQVKLTDVTKTSGIALSTSAPTVPEGSSVTIDSSCPPLPNFNLSATPSLFNATTDIAFDLLQPGVIALRIYDITGRLVRTLASGSVGGGWHHYTWNGTSDSGTFLASGFYTCIASGMVKADFVKIELLR